MALTTFGFRTTSATYDWEVVVDGANFQRFGIRAVKNRDLRVAVATAAPAIDSNDWFPLAGVDGFSEELAANEKVYVRSDDNNHVTVRGYKVSR